MALGVRGRGRKIGGGRFLIAHMKTMPCSMENSIEIDWETPIKTNDIYMCVTGNHFTCCGFNAEDYIGGGNHVMGRAGGCG